MRTNHYEGVETCSLSAAQPREDSIPVILSAVRFRPVFRGHPVTAVVLTALAGTQWRDPPK